MLWISAFLFMFSFFLSFFFLFGGVWLVEFQLVAYTPILSFTMVADFFSFLFAAVVLFISSMVFFFSQYYMDTDKNLKGFSLLLLLFVLSMLLLIFSPNLFSILLGWDGLGVVSYLLVVYYLSYASSSAGMLTFLMNRVGDVFFLFSVVLLSFLSVWDSFVLKDSVLLLAGILAVTFITKSAQIPFSSWLPAAMAAPTPVSSLVHSSTLVTAGVFMLVRFYGGMVSVVYSYLAVMAILTLLMAGFMANFEEDMKKIIAFSTLSQLGFMVFSISIGLIFFCFFHLLCHALFKATLFMTSGVMIHNSDSSQEFRNTLNFSGSTPFLMVSSVVCILCLVGFPFLSGFFSKDFILDGVSFNMFLWGLFSVGVFCTVLYSVRFSIYVFKLAFFIRSGVMKYYAGVWYILFPVFLLLLSAVFLGGVWAELLIGMYVSFSIFSGFWKVFYISALFICLLLVMSLGFVLNKKVWLNKYFFSSMWFLKNIMGLKTLQAFLSLGFTQHSVAESGWMELCGPQGMYSSGFKMALLFSRSYGFTFFSLLSFFFFFFFLFS